MIKIENVAVWGFEGAIRGMRNPMNSWHLSDSVGDGEEFAVGSKDMHLMKKLLAGGPVHAKYLRMVHVQMDITAPMYWWKEFDTYKVATVRNSCSTMHKIHARPFRAEDFSAGHLTDIYRLTMEKVIVQLNGAREEYLETVRRADQAKEYREKVLLQGEAKEKWWQMIQLLPSSYNQKSTIDINYQTVIEMIKWRENHKLDEWRELVKELKKLPHMEELLNG